MRTLSTYEIVKSLIGPINPIGETNADNKRFENLKEMCELLDEIHTAIDDIAYQYKGMSEFSIKRACDYANEQLDKMGIRE